MKLLITLLLFSQTLFAQQTPDKFRNQGEAEDYSAIQFFDTAYVKQNFKRFGGSIKEISLGNYTFDNKTLVVWGTANELFNIFSEGIFYPQLLIGFGKNNPVKSKDEILKLSSEENFRYIMSRNDTLKISDLEELKFLSKSHKVKRFRFWFYRPGFANPIVIFIELKNRKATRNMKIDDFIKGSKLTFLKSAWLII